MLAKSGIICIMVTQVVLKIKLAISNKQVATMIDYVLLYK